MIDLRRHLTVATIALTIVTVGCSGHTTRPASSSVTTTTRNNGTVTTTPRSAIGLTAEQLNAHLGVDVPAGWVPVDAYHARVWVPEGWQLQGPGGCTGDTSAPGIVSIGVACRSLGVAPVAAVALIPFAHPHAARSSFNLNGYRAHKVPDTQVAGWLFYAVPQLGVQIALHGTLGSRILDTLGPSARTIALDPTRQSVPSNWHALAEDGVSFSIPPSWALITPTEWSCDGWTGGAPALFVVNAAVNETCPDGIPPVEELQDGAVLYAGSHNDHAPTPTASRPIVAFHHGSTTVTVYTDDGYLEAFDLFVHRAGSSITHVLTLGLGRDGRVAGGVLGSVRAVT